MGVYKTIQINVMEIVVYNYMAFCYFSKFFWCLINCNQPIFVKSELDDFENRICFIINYISFKNSHDFFVLAKG